MCPGRARSKMKKGLNVPSQSRKTEKGVTQCALAVQGARERSGLMSTGSRRRQREEQFNMPWQ